MATSYAPAMPLRAVIVDDTEDLRELLRMALVRGGMRVVGEAGDGLAGVEAVRALQPDVILLDLSMPVMDGLEALPLMRELAPDARIIVLSGFGASAMAERALAIGADAYLQKGASLGRILDHIRDVVNDRTSLPGQPRPTPLEPAVVVRHHRSPAAASDPRGALALAPFGVVEIDPEPPYRIIAANPSALGLLEEQTVPGVALCDAAPALAETITENRLRGDFDFESSSPAGPIQVVLRHTPTSLLLYLRPITDEVGMLRSAIATTAHEIRGPVAVLCAIAETICDGENDIDPEQYDRLMASIGRQARMLDSITADLLTAAQIQRGTLRIDSRPIEPLGIVEAVVQDRYAETVTVEVEDRRRILVDPLRLEQMLGNLLSNAHKYGAPPVVLRLRPCREFPHQVCIDVQDSGPGVPVEFRLQLFAEFTRAPGTAVPGTGLGLHVVHTLAQAQGGSISYASTVGGGAIFTLTMPAARN